MFFKKANKIYLLKETEKYFFKTNNILNKQVKKKKADYFKIIIYINK